MLNTRARFFSFIFIMSLVFVLAVYLSFFKFEEPKNKPELKPVSLMLKWLHQSQFTGNYVAKDKGFYTNNGLDVEIRQFSEKSPIIESIISGDIDFGIVGADEVVIAREKGLPIKAVAVIYKTSPICIYSLKSKNIKEPRDLFGKTLGVSSDTRDIYYAMMNKLDLDRSSVREVEKGFDPEIILKDNVDASTGYIINEPNVIKEKGKEINTILMANYGVNMYADVVVTSDKKIEDDPDMVKNFVGSTLEGWKYAIENQDEAVDIVIKYAIGSDKKHQKNMFISSIPLIQKGNTKLGWMEKAEWEQIEKILWEQKIIKNRVDVSTVFTEQFYK